MRIPNSAHRAQPWVIDEIAPDFRLLDVWALPVEGTLDEFGDFLEGMASFDPAAADSTVTRLLFALRFRLGEWLGWDDATKTYAIPGCTETTLATRLPEDLRGSASASETGGAMKQSGFVPLYRTDVEYAAEISNATVHGVVHFGWVERAMGRYRAQMAVYVKPRGRVGEVYLMLIAPFRHLVVYPALVRQIGRAWEENRSWTQPAS